MKVLEIINIIIGIVFLLCYSYQFLYIPISVFAKQKKHKDEVLHSRNNRTDEIVVHLLGPGP